LQEKIVRRYFLVGRTSTQKEKTFGRRSPAGVVQKIKT